MSGQDRGLYGLNSRCQLSPALLSKSWHSGIEEMASKARGVGLLKVEAGNFARTTRVSAECVRREVTLARCPVTSWTVISPGDLNKLSTDSFSEGQLLELSVKERMPGDEFSIEEPEKIGVIDADRMRGHLSLPPHAFAAMWSAAEASEATRSIELELKARQAEILAVTNVRFFEGLLQSNAAAGNSPHGRDPILVELREIRKELIPLIRSSVFWFFVLFGLLAFFLTWTGLESHHAIVGDPAGISNNRDRWKDL